MTLRLALAVFTALMMATPALGMTIDALGDNGGDVTIAANGATLTSSDARWGPQDLIALRVTETEETIDFELEVRDLTPDAETPLAEDAVWRVYFTHEDQSFRVRAYRAVADQVYYWGIMERFDAQNNFFSFMQPMPIEADVGANTVTFSVPRIDLLDGDGAAPFPGRSISNFWAESHLRTNEGQFFNFGQVVLGPQWDVRDRMPDNGLGSESLPIMLGLTQDGHAALWSSSPMRASNGEESTYVFRVQAQNRGDVEDRFQVTVEGTPEEWSVVLLDPFVTLAPGEIRELPVLVSTPFQHRHGAVETFRMTMQSLSDTGSTGRIELGIRYHEVPQPAGHHDTLYLHSARWGDDSQLFFVVDAMFSGNGGLASMNTIEDPETDQDVPITGQFQGWGCHTPCSPDNPPHAKHQWSIWLQPTLEMGLDFDLERTGTLTLPIQSANSPIEGGVLEGYLLHFGYSATTGQWTPTVLAPLEPIRDVSMAAGETRDFEFTLQPTEAADLVPFAKRAAMMIWVNLTTVVPHLWTGAEAPSLMPGGVMQLPLNEYRDPVDSVLAGLDDLDLRIIEPESLVNAGETRLVRAELTNHLDDAATFDLALQGVNVGWAQISDGDSIRVPAHETVPILIAVSAPEGASAATGADLVLTAQARIDPSIRSLARFYVDVVTQDVPDDAAQAGLLAQSDDKGSPGVTPLLLIGALLLTRRRD